MDWATCMPGSKGMDTRCRRMRIVERDYMPLPTLLAYHPPIPGRHTLEAMRIVGLQQHHVDAGALRWARCAVLCRMCCAGPAMPAVLCQIGVAVMPSALPPSPVPTLPDNACGCQLSVLRPCGHANLTDACAPCPFSRPLQCCARWRVCCTWATLRSPTTTGGFHLGLWLGLCASGVRAGLIQTP